MKTGTVVALAAIVAGFVYWLLQTNVPFDSFWTLVVVALVLRLIQDVILGQLAQLGTDPLTYVVQLVLFLGFTVGVTYLLQTAGLSGGLVPYAMLIGYYLTQGLLGWVALHLPETDAVPETVARPAVRTR